MMSDLAKIVPREGGGTSVAPAWWVRGLAATLCTLSMGCLITDDITFPEEIQCPPAISSAPNADNPLNEIARALEGSGDGDAGAGTDEEVFEVVVWDCNVSQDLASLVSVDFEPDIAGAPLGRLFQPGAIPADGTTRRTFQFTLSEAELMGLGEGCHTVELLVSSEFEFLSRKPKTEGDLGTATWFLIVDEPFGMTEVSCP